MATKGKIIYIAGSGRSGSTILSLLLSQHRATQNVGQIRDLFLANKAREFCSCGARMRDCDFWRPVLREFPEEAASGVRLSKCREATVKGVYGAAFRSSGKNVLIDSSKSADLCETLLACGKFQVFVLNLLRDPRAVAVSWSHVLPDPMVLRKRCRNWVQRQRRIEAFGRRSDVPHYQLRYEDFAQDPMRYVAEIQRWCGLDADLSMFSIPNVARIDWQRQHLFPPANRGVLSRREDLEKITPATAWQSGEFTPVRRMAEEFCFPFAERYGYVAERVT